MTIISWKQLHEIFREIDFTKKHNDFKKEEIVVKYNEQSYIFFSNNFWFMCRLKIRTKKPEEMKWKIFIQSSRKQIISVSYHQIQDLRRRIRKYFVIWKIRQFEFYFLQHQTKHILCTKQYCTEGAAIRAFLLQLVLVLKTQCTQISI